MINRHVVWLRNDLRLDDHPAIWQAQALGHVHVVFIATTKQWQQHHESPARLGLKAAALKDIARQLAKLGIPFTVLETDWFSDVPHLLINFCQQAQINTVWFQQETPLDENTRDNAVSHQLAKAGIQVNALPHDLIVSAPVKTQSNEPFKVFTPYYRKWLSILEDTLQTPLPSPKQQGEALPTHAFSCQWAGDFRVDIWPADEQTVLNKLISFTDFKLMDYGKNRDFPAQPATSTLSPYLANGQIGPRRLISAIQLACGEHNIDWRHHDWLRELAWRDFYRQLLLYYPALSKGKPFQANTQHVAWREDNIGFQAWCEGQTGFPIIDAAMRQLHQTGWMHNRLRMLTASFLSKLLLIDWRHGEDYFLKHLIDGEYAANNGGWQWSASTGVDAAPYFRVFNPTLQSQRFDADGVFIKRFVPEIAHISAKHIHNPPTDVRTQCGYPLPIIDYKSARIAAISTFKNLPIN